MHVHGSTTQLKLDSCFYSVHYGSFQVEYQSFAEDIGKLVATRYTLATAFIACSVKFTQFVTKVQKPVNYTSNRTITVNDVTLVHSSDVFL